MNLKRIDIDGDTFALLDGGEMLFLCQREFVNTMRGRWLLFDARTWKQLDRDQYRDDLIERAECGRYAAIDRAKAPKHDKEN